MRKITASKEKIEYNKQKIADIKAAGNIQDEEIPDVEPEAPWRSLLLPILLLKKNNGQIGQKIFCSKSEQKIFLCIQRIS